MYIHLHFVKSSDLLKNVQLFQITWISTEDKGINFIVITYKRKNILHSVL